MEVGEVAGDGGGFGAAEPVVDGQRLGERCGGGGDIVGAVCAASQAHQCTCLVEGCAHGAGERAGLGEQDVRVTRRGVVQGEITHAVERLDLPITVTDVGVQGVRLGEQVESLVVVACPVVHAAEVQAGIGLPAPVAEKAGVGDQLVGLVEHLLRPLVVPPQVIQVAEEVEGVCLPAPVAEIGEQLEGLVEHLLRPLPVPPLAIRDAAVDEGDGLPKPITKVGEQLESLVEHLLRPPPLPPQVIRVAEVTEGDSLPELVTEVGEQLVGLVVRLLRLPPLPPQVMHLTEVGEGGGLPGPVVGAFGGGQRGVVDVVSLVPGAADPQIVLQGGGQCDNQIGRASCRERVFITV